MDSKSFNKPISQSEESYYEHLEDERLRKEQYWNDLNDHWDELNALQSPSNTTKKYYKKIKGLQNEYYK